MGRAIPFDGVHLLSQQSAASTLEGSSREAPSCGGPCQPRRRPCTRQTIPAKKSLCFGPRLDDPIWFTDETIEAWAAEPRTTRGGQPWCSALAILTALTLRAVFRLAYRQAEGLIGSVVGLLGLALRVPDHTTLSRWATTLEVPQPRLHAGRRGDVGPLHLLVDSTCRRLRSSAVVREIEAPFVLTLGETETPCVLAIAETGLTLSETCARSRGRAHAF